MQKKLTCIQCNMSLRVCRSHALCTLCSFTIVSSAALMFQNCIGLYKITHTCLYTSLPPRKKLSEFICIIISLFHFLAIHKHQNEGALITALPSLQLLPTVRGSSRCHFRYSEDCDNLWGHCVGHHCGNSHRTLHLPLSSPQRA